MRHDPSAASMVSMSVSAIRTPAVLSHSADSVVHNGGRSHFTISASSLVSVRGLHCLHRRSSLLSLLHNKNWLSCLTLRIPLSTSAVILISFTSPYQLSRLSYSANSRIQIGSHYLSCLSPRIPQSTSAVIHTIFASSEHAPAIVPHSADSLVHVGGSSHSSAHNAQTASYLN